MKVKTFRDLGLDEGDKYLNKLSTEYDLGELDKLLGNSEEEKLREEKMKEIKDKI